MIVEYSHYFLINPHASIFADTDARKKKKRIHKERANKGYSTFDTYSGGEYLETIVGLILKAIVKRKINAPKDTRKLANSIIERLTQYDKKLNYDAVDGSCVYVEETDERYPIVKEAHDYVANVMATFTTQILPNLPNKTYNHNPKKYVKNQLPKNAYKETAGFFLYLVIGITYNYLVSSPGYRGLTPYPEFEVAGENAPNSLLNFSDSIGTMLIWANGARNLYLTQYWSKRYKRRDDSATHLTELEKVGEAVFNKEYRGLWI